MNPPVNLLNDYLDGALGAAESVALQQWLAQDPANVRELVRLTHDHAFICSALEAEGEFQYIARPRLASPFPFAHIARAAAVITLICAFVFAGTLHWARRGPEPVKDTVDSTLVPTSPTGVLLQPPVGAGSLLREAWFNIDGSHVGDLFADPSFPDSPPYRDYPTSFETVDGGSTFNLYGTRWRGFILPPVSGAYRFWIAADDSAELYLSSDDTPRKKLLIAACREYAARREWNKYPEQQSAAVPLKAGRHYFIEALQKESAGGDHISVAWQIPGREPEVIQGKNLEPWNR